MQYYYISFHGQFGSGEFYAMSPSDIACESQFRQWYDERERQYGELYDYGIESIEPGKYYFQAKAHPETIMF